MIFIVGEFTAAGGTVCMQDVCEYNFVVSHARTMTYFEYETNGGASAFDLRQVNDTCLQVQSNSFRTGSGEPIGTCVDDPFERDLGDKSTYTITADGFIRNVITINGRFPGRNIEVKANSTVSLSHCQ